MMSLKIYFNRQTIKEFPLFLKMQEYIKCWGLFVFLLEIIACCLILLLPMIPICCNFSKIFAVFIYFGVIIVFFIFIIMYYFLTIKEIIIKKIRRS
jgi:hypothetical protein